jgi:hypothetical protein
MRSQRGEVSGIRSTRRSQLPTITDSLLIRLWANGHSGSYGFLLGISIDIPVFPNNQIVTPIPLEGYDWNHRVGTPESDGKSRLASCLYGFQHRLQFGERFDDEIRSRRTERFAIKGRRDSHR